MLGPDPRAGLGREERRERRHALLPGGLADVHRRLDAQAPDPALDHVLQQVAVVARHFDDERLRAQVEALPHRLDVTAGVLHPRGREGGVIGVGVGEDLLSGQNLRQLHEQAFGADAHM